MQPSDASLSRACENSITMSLWFGPACQARSAKSRGSPAKEGGLDKMTSNSGRERLCCERRERYNAQHSGGNHLFSPSHCTAWGR